MQNWGIAGNFVLFCVLNNMPPIITSKASPGGQIHMKVIQMSKVATLTRYWSYLSIYLFVSSALKKSGYCNNLETSEVLVGTIPRANLAFPCISQSDNLKSSQNFENLSLIKNLRFRATVFVVYIKTITLNFSECGLSYFKLSPFNKLILRDT